METLILFGILVSTYLLFIVKRMPALIRSFRSQAFFLFLATFVMAWQERRFDLYVVAGLLFILKVAVIPNVLTRMTHQIKTNENIGLLINPQLSLGCALGLSYLSWIFARSFLASHNSAQIATLSVAFFVVAAGMFAMVFRITALAQIVGLLIMENGLFLLAATVSGGMPFFVEIAIFFDVFVSVIILGFFVFRINKFFTHIDVNKLSRLRG